MSDSIRAIETVYQGYRFRSRSEARWAVYLTAIGLDWQYEPEGYVLTNPYHNDSIPWPNPVTYLPDFWLPQVRMFAEVKPGPFDDEAFYKAALLSCCTGKSVLLLDGPPDMRTYDYVDPRFVDPADLHPADLNPDRLGDSGTLTDCVISMYHGYPVDEHRFFSSTGGVKPSDFAQGGMFDDVPAAVFAARGARFEYGECGAKK
jgi:hypothetical protein